MLNENIMERRINKKIEDLKTAKEALEKQLSNERNENRDLQENLNNADNDLSNERNKNKNLKRALREIEQELDKFKQDKDQLINSI